MAIVSIRPIQSSRSGLAVRPSSGVSRLTTRRPAVAYTATDHDRPVREVRLLVLRIFLSGRRFRVLSKRSRSASPPTKPQDASPGACFVWAQGENRALAIRPIHHRRQRRPPMIVVMKPGSTPQQIEHVVNLVREMGLKEHVIVGTERTVVAVIGERPVQGPHGAGNRRRRREGRADPGAVQDGVEGSEEGADDRPAGRQPDGRRSAGRRCRSSPGRAASRTSSSCWRSRTR